MTTGFCITGHWIGVHDGDPRALELFKRHYSYRRRASGHPRGSPTFVGQGEKLVLLTLDCAAIFVWQFSTVPRVDGQLGVRCSIFRNESPLRSSDLILEAEELAWSRWPGQRLFTYVWPTKLRQPTQKYRKPKEPGRCFIKAAWKQCGSNADGRLIILEKLPPALESP